MQVVLENNSQQTSRLILPKTAAKETIIAATPRRIYGNAHAYQIHSISSNSDGETFLSGDDLRINLWHTEHPNDSYCIVDIKPASIDDLTEVITCAKFHPSFCNVMGFSTSKGAVKIADLRDSAIIDGKAVRSLGPGINEGPSFFSEITSSISDIAFCTGNTNLIAGREYLNVKVWDLRNDVAPLLTLPVHDYIKPKLCDLYENDTIFDKFTICFSSDGKHVVTGTYGNRVRVIPLQQDPEGCYSETLTADKSILIGGAKNKTQIVGKKSPLSSQLNEVDPETIDYEKKTLHISLNGDNDCIAVAAATNLFMFTNTSK